MKNRYSFTRQSLENIALYGIDPGEVWQVLHARRRLTRHLSEESAAVFGATRTGRPLVVLVLESAAEGSDWEIVAAREMNAEEAAVFDRYVGRQS